MGEIPIMFVLISKAISNYFKEASFMRSAKKMCSVLLLLNLFSFCTWAGTTGKISGTFTDKNTGCGLEVLVVIDNTSFTAFSDSAGHYTILSIPPGTYTMRISSMEYEISSIKNIKVWEDHTTFINFQLNPSEEKSDSVDFENCLIKSAVFMTTSLFSDSDIGNLPVNNIVSVIGLEAGIRGGWNSSYKNSFVEPVFNSVHSTAKIGVPGDLSIRGNEGESILFLVDGIAQRDPRNSEALTGIPLSAIKEFTVEKGGINAEYGETGPGIIHIITKEGNRENYSGSFQFRYSAPAPKFWKGPGILDISDPYSFALRPYFDPDVCWTGTDNGAWDNFTQRQYRSFPGWNSISERMITDDDPTNNFSPAALQRIFMYETRKKMRLNEPDYDIDAGFGGPVPFLGNYLGNSRFFTSYRSTREMLLIPLSRPDYKDYDWLLQINSDISKAIRLRLFAGFGKQYTTRGNFDPMGVYSYLRKPEEISEAISEAIGPFSSFFEFFPLFSDFYFCNAEISNKSFSARLTHNINPKTFYEASIDYFYRAYDVHPIGLRDTSVKYEVVPGFFEDSNPFGYWPYTGKGLFLETGYDAALPRDYTTVSSTKIKADITHQLNFRNEVKSGFELVLNDLSFNYESVPPLFNGYRYRVKKQGNPLSAGFYIQDKIEIENIEINTGLRLDFSSLNLDWLDLNPNNLTPISHWGNIKSLPKKHSSAHWAISPRLSAAWKFIDNAELYFSYGHYNQTIQYENMYRSDVNVGDPNLGFGRIISYEAGFNYRFLNDFMFQAGTFYTDKTKQPSLISYIREFVENFDQVGNTNYENIRGLEVILRKVSGEWVTGFINYTYQKNKIGFIGSSRYYDSPYYQMLWDKDTDGLGEDHPAPRPYARANINIQSPFDFGPSVAGYNILGGFGLNVIADWQAGYKATYNPNRIPNTHNNVQVADFFNITIRLDKIIDLGNYQVQLFMDMDNALNTHRLWNNYNDSYDNLFYLSSLHLPKSDAYNNIPGNDKMGDYRKPGVEFQPIEWVSRLAPAGEDSRLWYYEEASGKYFEWKNNQWSEVEENRLSKALEDKAYIDMPNASTFWFLDPRKVYFGIKFSFSLP